MCRTWGPPLGTGRAARTTPRQRARAGSSRPRSPANRRRPEEREIALNDALQHAVGKLRYMVAGCGVKWLFLDHLSMAASQAPVQQSPSPLPLGRLRWRYLGGSQ
jgi:hypothetical protein